MKFRKVIKYGLVSFFFAFAVYFIFCLMTNYRPEEILPPEPQAVLHIHRPKKILSEHDFVFEEYPEFARMKKFLPLIPDFHMMLSKLAFGPVLVVDMRYYRGASYLAFALKDRFLKPKEDGFYIEENPVLSKQDPDSFVLKYGKETLGFIARKRNLLIITPFLKALQMAIAHLSMEEKPGDLDRGGDVSLYFQTGRVLADAAKLYPQLAFLQGALAKNHSGILRLDFKSDRVFLDLKLNFSAPENQKEEILARMLSLAPGKKKMRETVPLRSGTFVSVNLNDFKEFYLLLMEYFKDSPEIFEKLQTGVRALQYLSKKKPIEEVLFNWMDGEIGAVSLSGAADPLFLMRIADFQDFQEGFSAFIGSSAGEAEGHAVYAVELPGVYQFLKNLLAPSARLPYFTLFEGRYLLFGNSVQEINAFLRLSQARLIRSSEFQKSVKGLDSKAQIEFYSDLSYGMVPLAKISPLLSRLMQKYPVMGGSIRADYPEVRVKINLVKDEDDED